ncbi:MAG: hypothetical protein HWD58_11810 [Bacteroidota bacterium]|nr:MAG: hypothetical protein HWD58_11810 [Bacteroidota bacterium]
MSVVCIAAFLTFIGGSGNSWPHWGFADKSIKNGVMVELRISAPVQTQNGYLRIQPMPWQTPVIVLALGQHLYTTSTKST